MRSELKRQKALDGFKAMLLAEGAIQEEQADEIDSLLHTIDPSVKEKQLFQAEGMLLHLRYLPGSMITKNAWSARNFSGPVICRSPIVQTPVGRKHLKGKWVLNGHTTQTTITASEQSAH